MKLSYVLLFVAATFTFSCNKKWKKTAPAGFNIYCEKSIPGNTFLSFQSGTIYLDKFGMEGDRKQGDDVTFENEFQSSSEINVSTSVIIPALSYDIPQGTYTELRVDLRIRNSSGGNSITLNGGYDNGTIIIPVIFEFMDKIDIRMFATSSGGGDITLLEDSPASATISFHIMSWFGTVTSNMLDNATQTDIGGVMTIVINDNENSDIYDAVVNRIGLSETVIFN